VKNPIDQINPAEKAKRWPKAATTAFLCVLIGSFMPWGVITHHYTWRFMANMHHPGLCNRIMTADDLSCLKPGAPVYYRGSAWTSGFDLMGFFFPHWLLTLVALWLFICAISRFFDFFHINPSIPQILSFYGMIHVGCSALGFFSQGIPGWGLILTGFGYLIFICAFLRWK
jgi:hypothetical protein